MLLKLAHKSLLSRMSSVMLTVVSITTGIMLMILLNFTNQQVKSSFSKTISGIDLIVGAKTSDVNLLLYSVFHKGVAADNISWSTYQELSQDPLVAWGIPIALGDSHRGHRVVGTNQNHMKHFKYGNQQPLTMASGEWFSDPFEVVLGHDVAQKLKYPVGHQLNLSHGVSQNSFQVHDQIQFRVSGVLNPTGTPVDQSIYVSLSGLEAAHLNWPDDPEKKKQLIEYIKQHGLEPASLTAVFIALKNKSSTFVFQRKISKSPKQTHAILPGVALAQIWNMSQMFEQVVYLIGIMVFLATIVGLANVLMTSLQARKKELSLLRIIGASPLYCFLLVQAEALFMVLVSIVSATVLTWFLLWLFADWLGSAFGLFIDLGDFISPSLFKIHGVVLLTEMVSVCVPAMMFYRQSTLNDTNH